ncbi:MAG TPA: hypothetical protein VMC41_01625 [Candidatus Nanoarchaeia archaeon]|nr:hypothetical protein [Candidatus Nanoarchaeia archaeon]
MFSTSHDILLLTIATCVAAFTIFLCWGMFYLVAMTRNAFKIFKDVRRIFDKVEGVVDAVKEKVDSSAGYLFLIGEGIKKVVEIAKVWHAKQSGDECEGDDDEECDCEECNGDGKYEEKSSFAKASPFAKATGDRSEDKPRKIKVKEK